MENGEAGKGRGGGYDRQTNRLGKEYRSCRHRPDQSRDERAGTWIDWRVRKFPKEHGREPFLTIVNAGLPRFQDHGIMKMRNRS